MSFLTILDTESGQVVFSMILGLGLAMLFQRVCNEEKCTIYVSPPGNKIDDKTFTQNGKCYKYEKVGVPCKA